MHAKHIISTLEDTAGLRIDRGLFRVMAMNMAPELPLMYGELCGKTRHTFFGSARKVPYLGEPMYG